MKDIMIDIETLGTKPYSLIMSLAAVRFDVDTGRMGESLYRRIDAGTAEQIGLKLDLDTVLWWSAQDELTRNEAMQGNEPIMSAMTDLLLFIGEDSEQRIWSNSPSFDLSLVKNALELLSLEPSWEYFQERDVRTISGLYPEIRKSIPFEGDRHNPLADCVHQIRYLVCTMNRIKTN